MDDFVIEYVYSILDVNLMWVFGDFNIQAICKQQKNNEKKKVALPSLNVPVCNPKLKGVVNWD